jgi:hypothetical protein
METMRAPQTPQLTPAPRGREMLAAVIDMAAIGVPYALYIRQAARSAGGREGLQKLGGRPGRVLDGARLLISEQIGSPGARIAGVRTVDSRTGRRMALWRTLVIVLARVLTGELQRRAAGARAPISQADAAESAREMRSIMEAHADDDDARRLALAHYFDERRIDAHIGWRTLAGVVAAALVNHWLRRRLAPTTVIVSRGAGSE